MRQNITQDAWDACTQAAGMSFYTCQSFTAHLAGELDRYHAAMSDENADPKTRKYAAAAIAEWGPHLAKFRERQEFLERRLDHALKCLKRKKLWAPDVEALMILCEDQGRMRERGVLQMIHCTMDNRILSVGRQSELDDNCWKIGIDLTMTEQEPDLADTASLYGPALERNAGRIFANTFMAACASKVTQLMDSDNYKGLIEQPLLDRYFDSDHFQKLLESKLAKPIADNIMESIPMDGYAKHLEERLEDAMSTIQEMSNESRNAVNKAIAPVQAKAEKLQAENAGLKAQNATLQAENAALSDALAERDRQLSEYSAMAVPEDLLDLPGSDVIFAGGHPNMTKKLRQDHPGWTFIAGGDVNFPEFRDPKIIFFWDKHMSHPMWHRVRKFARPSVPQAYLKSTNIDMLEDEMRRAWSMAARNENGGGGGPDR